MASETHYAFQYNPNGQIGSHGEAVSLKGKWLCTEVNQPVPLFFSFPFCVPSTFFNLARLGNNRFTGYIGIESN